MGKHRNKRQFMRRQKKEGTEHLGAIKKSDRRKNLDLSLHGEETPKGA